MVCNLMKKNAYHIGLATGYACYRNGTDPATEYRRAHNRFRKSKRSRVMHKALTRATKLSFACIVFGLDYWRKPGV